MEAIQELAGEVRQADQTIMFCCEFLIWPPPEKKIGPHPGLDGTFLTTTGLALQMEAFTLSAVAQIFIILIPAAMILSGKSSATV